MTSRLLAIVLVAAAPVSAAEIARVKSSDGAATIERGATRLAATPGQVIEPGDRLLAGRGKLSITFIDNSRMALAPGAQLTIARFDYDRRSERGQFVSDLRRGKVAIVAGQIARSGDNAMIVRTGGAALAIRTGRLIVTAP